MSHAEPSKIGTTRTITTDRAARREDRASRNRKRRAVETNELRFALDEARTLRQFKRILAGA